MDRFESVAISDIIYIYSLKRILKDDRASEYAAHVCRRVT